MKRLGNAWCHEIAAQRCVIPRSSCSRCQLSWARNCSATKEMSCRGEKGLIISLVLCQELKRQPRLAYNSCGRGLTVALAVQLQGWQLMRRYRQLRWRGAAS